MPCELIPLDAILRGLSLCLGGPVGTMRCDAVLILPVLRLFFDRSEKGEGQSGAAWRHWDGAKGDPNAFVPPDTSDDVVWNDTAPDLRIPLLPWAEQDRWGCEQKPGELLNTQQHTTPKHPKHNDPAPHRTYMHARARAHAHTLPYPTARPPAPALLSARGI